MNQFKFDWQYWRGGEKTIFISFFVAFISMFLNWSYGSFFPQNGFTQLTVVLLLFWAYPLIAILLGKKINISIGFGCSLGPFITTLFYIYSKNAEIFGGFMNLAGMGAWIFLFSCVALGLGMFQCALNIQEQVDPASTSSASEKLPPK